MYDSNRERGRIGGGGAGGSLPVVWCGGVDVDGWDRGVHICVTATGGSPTCRTVRGRGCGWEGPHKKPPRSAGGSFCEGSDRGYLLQGVVERVFCYRGY